MSNAVESPRPTVAITGAGSGLGRAIALKLAAKGYRVFGTARSQQHVAELAAASSGNVELTLADITHEPAVTAWVDKVTKDVGKHGLDVLISNAGTLTPGPLEVLPVDDVRREFEVNVFGALTVINSFLPALRKARGRIVQIGAFTGWVPVPFDGPSTARCGKYPRLPRAQPSRLRPFGIDIVMAQAGNMLTGGPAKKTSASATTPSSSGPVGH